MNKSKIGLIGLAVMGQNLVLNFANKGIPIAVFNRTTWKMEKFVKDNPGKPIHGEAKMEDFVACLERPRKIILLVQAGPAVDAMVDSILPYLEKDDIIIDGGNSYFKDTIQRHKTLAERGIKFVGMGVSGGERGALEGPSLMPGGDRSDYDLLAPLLTRVAAQEPAPCVDFIGNGGAGHFVKMVHNGIEYADMQLISEIYDIARRVYKFSDAQVSQMFEYFQKTDLNSYLIDITQQILNYREQGDNELLVHKIRDEAKGKGTGSWTVQESSLLGAPVPAIAAALDSRNISSSLSLRKVFSSIIALPEAEKKEQNMQEIFALLEKTLLVGKILAYDQGFTMLRSADTEYGFELNMASIAKIWRNGCIIRSTMLDEMSRALSNDNDISLLQDEYFKSRILGGLSAIQEVISLAVRSSIPTPALGTSLWYLQGLSTPTLPANLIQAQRDFFGAHTYKRFDKDGDFHTQWES